jgi:hypothetical protein
VLRRSQIFLSMGIPVFCDSAHAPQCVCTHRSSTST